MSLTIEGTLINLSPIEMIGAEGTLAKRNLLLQTLDPEYPKTICFDLLGDICQKQEGLSGSLRVHFDIQSNQSKKDPDRWFTSAKIWKVEPLTISPAAASAPVEEDNQDLDPEDEVPF